VLTNMAAGGASILARDTSSVIRREPSGYVSPPGYDLTNDPGGRASSSVSPPPSSSTSSSSSSTSSSMSSSPGSTTQSGHTMETSPTPSSGTEQDQFANKLRENFDVILEMLEETIVREIDRRGGRYRGDF
jgi:Tfp pilus tip-associated adhesin PilY1